jgi:CheY-like chemotaxis protein
LAFAMKDGRIGAALASAEILGEIGSAELLFSGSGYPRPLGDAMQHGDRRLRVAAARAVVKLDPDTDFPAASRVPEVLAFVAGTAGMRKVLVADPRSEAAQTLVGLAAELGYDGEAAYTGYHAIKVALAEPDFALVLISDTLDYCDANELYQMLRKDPRTARLPIGLIVREENRDRWQAQLAKDPLAQAFPRPFDADTMSFFTRRLLIDVGRMAIGDAERMAQATQALDDLLKLAEQPQRYNFYDLIRHEAHIERALFTPELTEKSLVNRASQNATDLAGRQAAAEAFAEAVSLRGTLLTIPDIKLQYERYNQSEQLDAGTQEVLASILDAIEQRARDAK